jgi:hypothetical protein
MAYLHADRYGAGVPKETKRGLVAHTITGLLITIGALSVIVARMIWPKLGIDAITVTLLALAALPWLGTIFKSISTPFGGAEYREFEDRLQTVAGAAESARLIAETSEARDLARQDVRASGNEASLIDLAATYDVTRGNMKPGSARTTEMTKIVGRMVAAFEAGADVDVRQFLTDRTGGRRLAAYVRLYVKPDGSYGSSLVDAVFDEPQAFLQYWGLRGLARVVDANPEALDLSDREQLKRLSGQLPADRLFELRRVLARYE